MLKRERRDDDRIPFELFINEYVAERPHRAVTTNISPTGLYVNRVARRIHARDQRFVQLELALPGTGDCIWARGEIRYDELGFGGGEAMVHGAGIRLVTIARGHARLLRDFVVEQKRQKLERLLALVRYNRYH
jgi:hypothetical protein